MNKTTKTFKFKGYDWTELFDAFGIRPKKTPHFETLEEEEKFYDDVLLSYLKQRQNESYQPNPEDVKTIKRYLKELSKFKYDAGYSKVWDAMIEIDHDEVFMQFFFALYKHMWS